MDLIEPKFSLKLFSVKEAKSWNGRADLSSKNEVDKSIPQISQSIIQIVMTQILKEKKSFNNRICFWLFEFGLQALKYENQSLAEKAWIIVMTFQNSPVKIKTIVHSRPIFGSNWILIPTQFEQHILIGGLKVRLHCLLVIWFASFEFDSYIYRYYAMWIQYYPIQMINFWENK